MKAIRWWPHARERLRERGINEELVLVALEQPEQIISAGRHKIIHKRYRDLVNRKEYLLRIFVEESSEERIVRSVYRTSKITKYWRDDL